MALRIENQLPRFCFLRNEVRNTAIAAQVIAPEKREDFFSAVLPKMRGNFRGGELLGEERCFISAAQPGFAGVARRKASRKSFEIAGWRLKSAKRFIRLHLRRRA